MSKHVHVKNAVKRFGDFQAVNDVSIDIQKGELFTLLGPSGCGKTTLLRMIAGFNSIDSGSILFDDMVINNIPAHKRNTGMVFQNYAIFPHLTVFENVAYGLKARNIQKSEIQERVMHALDMVHIPELKDRQPSNMSGGQQQRIALARAIVIQPDILLMDEPLSNLDAKLRLQMRNTIRKMQKQLGITTIYVTHDQEEALAISDKIAVMNKGQIQQVGCPRDIYIRPVNQFVANFIGTSNFIDATIAEKNTEYSVLKISDDYSIKIKLKNYNDTQVKISVRPEEIQLQAANKVGVKGTVYFKTFLGDFITYEIELKNAQTAATQIIEVNQYRNNMEHVFEAGDAVSILFDIDKINVYDASGMEALVYNE